MFTKYEFTFPMAKVPEFPLDRLMIYCRSSLSLEPVGHEIKAHVVLPHIAESVFLDTMKEFGIHFTPPSES